MSKKQQSTHEGFDANDADDRVSPHGETSPPGPGRKEGQTRKPYDQEPDRKFGNFTGTGEPARKQPGGRD